jgi:hypothetical protein
MTKFVTKDKDCHSLMRPNLHIRATCLSGFECKMYLVLGGTVLLEGKPMSSIAFILVVLWTLSRPDARQL